MLRKTADAGPITALMVACRRMQRAAVEALLSTAEINVQSASGCTAVHLAAEEGDAHIARLLLDGGADVAFCDEDGCTPLLLACDSGH